MAQTATLTPDQKKQLNDAIKKTWEFIKEMKKLGVEMPDLVDKIEVLEKAVETGKDVAKAADEAQTSLEQYTANLKSACVGDEDEKMICEVQIDRQWQARNVNFVLSLKNKSSVVRNFIRIQLQKHLPEAICKKLELCRP